MRRLPVLAAFPLLASAVITPVAAADALIFSDLPEAGYHYGQRVTDKDSIVLRDKQQLNLVDTSGEVFRLVGPHENSYKVRPPDNRYSMDRLIRALFPEGGYVAPEIRGEEVAFPSRPEMLDLSIAGNKCLPPGFVVTLWKRPSTKAAAYRLQRSARQGIMTGLWPADTDSVTLTVTNALTDGEQLRLSIPDRHYDFAFTVRVTSLVSELSLDNALALAELGCVAQAHIMLNLMAAGHAPE